MPQISKDEYLQEDFDYTKLTKQELRSIMSENNVRNIPSITALKQVILEAYETEIHSRIKELRANFNNENIFQSSINEESQDKNIESCDGNISKNNSFISDLSIETSNKSDIKNMSSLKDKTTNNEKKTNNTFTKDMSNLNNKELLFNTKLSSVKSNSNTNNEEFSINNKLSSEKSISNTNNEDLSFYTKFGSEKSISNTNNEDLTVNRKKETEKSISNTNNVSFSNKSFNNTVSDEYLKINNEKKSPKNKFKVLINNKMLMKDGQNKKIQDLIKNHKEDKTIINDLKLNNSFILNTKNIKSSKNNLNSRIRYFLKLLIRFSFIFIILLYLYLRFVCPYCGTEIGFCIPLPRNTYLDKDSNLKAKKGYKLVNSFIRYSIIDNSELTEKRKKINKIVKMLEQIRGRQIYGFDTHIRISLDSLVDSENLKLSLINDNRVILENGFLYAKRGTVTLRIFLKYYIFKLSKIAFPILLGIIFIKYLLYERRKKQIFNSQVNLIVHEVFDILMRQLISSSKTSIFKSYVYELQLKEALEVKDNVWKAVKSIVENNSNISTEKDEINKTKWCWIGPIIKKDLVYNN